ncbi:MAG: U32 family peptidase [Bacteroidaceae bacterium]|nr:U32 family peptidase [Bacteroidaceae bacterium]
MKVEADTQVRSIELLAPARDAQTGREAILHGADAVYIGGPAFSARAAATTSVDDIATLCDFAHLYGARVYVALNTILYDDELRAAERLIGQLYKAGVDALIVQDMALLRMELPPIALHASTQTDIRTPEKALELQRAGFEQLVVARELSLSEIRQIHEAVHVPIEAFVHGALCVSYSGQCYASQYCFGRSANRGNCAQFCRLPFDLIDGAGRTVRTQQHLLSLRDMNRSLSLEEMMDAGVSSFKIEGRLKDVGYVKNTVAHYRRLIDSILARRAQDYRRSSFGNSQVAFAPDVSRSFNRGFTDYFLHSRTAHIASHESPASRGKLIGSVVRATPREIALRLNPGVVLSAGDGLCYIHEREGLMGFRVNRVEGSVVYPHQPQHIKPHTPVYRNHDAAYERELARPSATRTLSLRIRLSETPTGFALQATDESGERISLAWDYPHQTAQKPQHENIRTQLSRTGGTAWRVAEVVVETSAFVPSSTLSAWRREMVEALQQAHRQHYERQQRTTAAHTSAQTTKALDYRANVANHLAKSYYTEGGAAEVAPAYELHAPKHATIMTCRYCLRRELGACLKEGGASSLPEPLSLRLSDGRAFDLRFDCHRCEMRVMDKA